MEGESIFDCARIAGFTLPKTVTQSLTTTVTVPRGGSPTAYPVVPTAGGSALPTGVAAAPTGGRNGTKPAVVVTAGAPARVDRSLAWTGALLGAVAAVAALC